MTAVPINENVPVIKGLNISNDELEKATRNNVMLLIDVETSNTCNLNCRYCFRDVYGTKEALEKELPIEERLDLMKQARELGCRTVKITGAGEPLIDPYFWRMVEFANDLGMYVITFTNGSVITKEIADRLYKMDISIIVKRNSGDPKIEDYMVNKVGYAERRDKALQYLMDAGFNKTKPTRLGMDAVIVKPNKDGILEQLEYCRNNNIFPLFRPFMPIGGASNLKDWEISKQETSDLYGQAMKLDKEKFGINYSFALPYIGGVWCRQLHYALYVNILGEAYACTGSKKLLGSVRRQSLADIWNSDAAKKVQEMPYKSCPLREAYWRGEKDYDCI